MSKVKKDLKVGKVQLSYLTDKPDTSYSEGAVEDELLKLFKSNDSENKREELVSKNPSWSIRYHLSPRRGNLLRWYSFKPGSRVLEVGAGCGAITEELVKKDIKVTALELTQKRASVNAYRNKKSVNLEVVIGNLQDYKPTNAYDYVVCIGVLEYAGSFINGEGFEPYIKFLQMLKKNLKPNGTLLLAIENRLGLKYWAGAKEDHTGGYFDGINGYPNRDVRTFGKKELEKLLKLVKFQNSYFYYPYPDYKFPITIFSDNYLPGVHCQFPLSLLPTPPNESPRQYLFSEQSAMEQIEANNLFDQFSNSFLVEAS